MAVYCQRVWSSARALGSHAPLVPTVLASGTFSCTPMFWVRCEVQKCLCWDCVGAQLCPDINAFAHSHQQNDQLCLTGDLKDQGTQFLAKILVGQQSSLHRRVLAFFEYSKLSAQKSGSLFRHMFSCTDTCFSCLSALYCFHTHLQKVDSFFFVKLWERLFFFFTPLYARKRMNWDASNTIAPLAVSCLMAA